jgi:hypothetical protein
MEQQESASFFEKKEAKKTFVRFRPSAPQARGS